MLKLPNDKLPLGNFSYICTVKLKPKLDIYE